MRRKLAVVVIVLGVVFVAGAGVVRWVVAPRLTQLPSDTNTIRVYDGVAAAMVNPTATMATVIGPGVMRNVPIQVQHTTRVLDTRGQAALVADSRVLTMPGFTIADLRYRYGVDRRTFEPTPGFDGVVPTRGLTFNWPMDTRQHDYTGWVQDTMRTTPLHFVRAVRHGGVATYEFTARSDARPITDPQLLKLLPTTMSKADLLRTTPSLQLPRHRLLALNALMRKVPDPVPLGYTYAFKSEFWVAPASGIVVDMTQHEVRTVDIMDGARAVPVAPIMDMKYSFTPSTVVGATGDARKAASDLHKIRVTLPVLLLVVGAALVCIGGALMIRRRRVAGPPEDSDDATLAILVAPRERIGV